MSLSTLKEEFSNSIEALSIIEEKLQSGESLSDIYRYFNKPMKKANLVEKKVNAAYDIINESYNSLSTAEKKLVSLVETKNIDRLKSQIHLTESLSKSISNEKEAVLAKECIKTIKQKLSTGKLSFEEAAFKVIDLKSTVKSLVENQKHGGFITASLKNIGVIKNITYSILAEEEKAPEMVYIDFNVYFYPKGNDFSTILASLKNINRTFSRMSGTLNRLFREKGLVGESLDGHMIWDASVREHGIKPGESAQASVELALGLAQGVTNVRNIVIEVLNIINEYITNTYTNDLVKTKSSQMSDEEAERLAALKKQMRRLDIEDEDEGRAFGHDDNYGGMF
jgi:hypothetical protein